MKNLYQIPLYEEDIVTTIKNAPDLSYFSGKHVLITGATGLIGSYVVDTLCRWNLVQQDEKSRIHIYACSRDKERLKKRFQGCWQSEYLHFIQQDFSLPLTFDCPADFIIHAAGNAYPAAFLKAPAETIIANIQGTDMLLRYALEKKTQRFLFVSSGEVYGEGDEKITEFFEEYSGYIDILNPRSCYPLSKRTTENLCISYTAQFGIDTIIARPCHTYGPNSTSSDNRATVQFANNALKNEDIILKSEGAQMRSYCYIADCVSALLTVLIKGKSRQAYNLANPGSRITISEFARITADQVGRKVVFQIPNSIDLRQRTPITRAVLSSRKLEALGWHGHFDAQTGIQHMLRIMQEL